MTPPAPPGPGSRTRSRAAGPGAPTAGRAPTSTSTATWPPGPVGAVVGAVVGAPDVVGAAGVVRRRGRRSGRGGYVAPPARGPPPVADGVGVVVGAAGLTVGCANRSAAGGATRVGRDPRRAQLGRDHPGDLDVLRPVRPGADDQRERTPADLPHAAGAADVAGAAERRRGRGRVRTGGGAAGALGRYPGSDGADPNASAGSAAGCDRAADRVPVERGRDALPDTRVGERTAAGAELQRLHDRARRALHGRAPGAADRRDGGERAVHLRSGVGQREVDVAVAQRAR